MIDIWSAVIGGATGVAGSVIGAAVNEMLRRSNRIENYSSKIFEKRLAAYEELLDHMRAGFDAASEIMANSTFSYEQRHEAVSVVIEDISQLPDKNQLYLDDDLRAHCIATFMGAEDVFVTKDEAEREAVRRAIGRMYHDACRMIREDSGISGVDRLLKKIARPRISGEFIEYLRSERRRFNRESIKSKK